MKIALTCRKGMLVFGTICGLSLFGVGCGGDATAPAPVATPRLYWALTLNYHAVTLSTIAPYNTIQLAAVPRNSAGEPLTSDAVVRYSINDSSVLVTPAGLLTAYFQSAGVWVKVSMTVDGVTLRDSVIVHVTDEVSPPKLTTFSIQPATGTYVSSDCAILGNFNFFSRKQLRVQALDEHTQPMTAVSAVFRSADPNVARVDPITGYITPACQDEPTPVMLYAETTVYGVTMTDSVLFVALPPSFTMVQILPRIISAQQGSISYFNPGTVRVGVGAVVAWINRSSPATDITFEEPDAVEATTTPTLVALRPIPASGEGGNIASFIPDTNQNAISNFRLRKFATPGTYHYHSALYGTTGTVLVIDTTLRATVHE